MDIVTLAQEPGLSQYALAAAAVVSAVGAWCGVLFQLFNARFQAKASREALREQLTASAETVRRQIEAAAANTSKQARASVISASRQKWIDGLREDVAAFLSLEESYQIRTVSAAARLPAEENEERNRRLLLVVRRIQLRLNPDKLLHNELINSMLSVLKDSNPSSGMSAEVLVKAQVLFKSEWERIKKEAAGDI